MTEDTIFESDRAAPEPASPSTEQPAAAAPSGETPSAPAPASAAPPAAQDRAGWVPLDAHLSEREKRQALEREVAQHRRDKQERERQAQEASAEIPDPVLDPSGYSQWFQDRIKRAEESAYNRARGDVEKTSIALSQRALVRAIGSDKFQELVEWSKTQPEEVVRGWYESPDPYGDAFDDMIRAQKVQRERTVLERFGDKDPEAWIEEEIARRLAAQAGGSPQGATPARAAPRDDQGRFAPAAQQPKHRPGHLADVNGAAAPTPNSGGDGGFERLMASKQAAH